MEKSWIIAVIIIGAFVNVNSLRCYYCENCPASSLKDSQLVTCGSKPIDSNSTTSSTTTTTTTTVAPVNPGTNETKPGTNGTNPNTNGTAPAAVLRLRRGIATELDMRCTCYGIECNCAREGAVLKAVQYVDVAYVCASATVKGSNGTEKIVRGCAEPTICTQLVAEVNATDCKICTTDKCNGANTTQHSMIALLFVLTVLSIKNTN